MVTYDLAMPLFGDYVQKRQTVWMPGGAGNRPFDIVPGYAERSIMAYRLESVDPALSKTSGGACVADTGPQR